MWTSVAPDAFEWNRETGLVANPAKVHPINHVGRFFKVKGPLNIGRSPQGRPVVLQAGGSEAGQTLAARTADIVFSVVQDIDEAKAGYAALKTRLPSFGRRPEDVTVLQDPENLLAIVQGGRFHKRAETQLTVLAPKREQLSGDEAHELL